jgi:hypothetical protein
VAEGARLESAYGRKPIVGSNPTLSATLLLRPEALQLPHLGRRANGLAPARPMLCVGGNRALTVLDGELAVPCTRNPLSGVEFPLEVAPFGD